MDNIKENIAELRERYTEKFKENKQKLVKPKPPRYDEVYIKGVQWLDTL